MESEIGNSIFLILILTFPQFINLILKISVVSHLFSTFLRAREANRNRPQGARQPSQAKGRRATAVSGAVDGAVAEYRGGAV